MPPYPSTLLLEDVGSAARAQEILIPLAENKPPNRETLSILGRTYKDQWCNNPSNEHSLRQSFDYYNRAFDVEPPDFYPGINAATVAFLSPFFSFVSIRGSASRTVASWRSTAWSRS